jgi:hypothetical protein
MHALSHTCLLVAKPELGWLCLFDEEWALKKMCILLAYACFLVVALQFTYIWIWLAGRGRP